VLGIGAHERVHAWPRPRTARGRCAFANGIGARAPETPRCAVPVPKCFRLGAAAQIGTICNAHASIIRRARSRHAIDPA